MKRAIPVIPLPLGEEEEDRDDDYEDEADKVEDFNLDDLESSEED